MSTLWIAAVFVAGPVLERDVPDGADPSPTVVAAQAPLVPPRAGSVLRDAARATMRRWARPNDEQADFAAREFLVLYEELQQDEQLAASQRKQLRAKVRGRLQKLAEQITKRSAIEKRRAKENHLRPVGAAPGPPDILAQWGGFGGRRGPLGGAGMGGRAMPGAVMGGGGFGGFARPDDDYGEQLVELIQRTIAPSTWNVNGGPGSIYYWRPGRAIVVRQMSGVHDDVANALEQLRRAGR